VVIELVMLDNRTWSDNAMECSAVSFLDAIRAECKLVQSGLGQSSHKLHVWGLGCRRRPPETPRRRSRASEIL
jgi:hypothetical protein